MVGLNEQSVQSKARSTEYLVRSSSTSLQNTSSVKATDMVRISNQLPKIPQLGFMRTNLGY